MTIAELVAKLGFSVDRGSYNKANNALQSIAQSAQNMNRVMNFALIGMAAKKAVQPLVNLGKAAVATYGEYEQLVGGVKTLFGPGELSGGVEEYAKNVGKAVSEVQGEYDNLMAAQNLVMQNADDAWKTAGMSANQYMTTITNYAASLKASTGDSVEAAKLADIAIRDMSDNVNKMGTSMEMVQNAYNGLARGNYMMIDNLKLGYAGTKTEMERLVNDAAAMTDVQEDLGLTVKANDMSLANQFKAISVIQKNLGITGTTAREGMTTLQGSMAMAKSAWADLQIAIGKGEGIKQASANFATAAKYVVSNHIPVIKRSIEGVVETVKNLGPIIQEVVPGMITDLIPGIVSSLITIAKNIAASIPVILSSMFEGIRMSLRSFLRSVKNSFPDLSPTINKALAALREAPKVIDGIVEKMGGLDNILRVVKTAAAAFIAMFAFTKITDGIGKVIDIAKKLGGMFTPLTIAITLVVFAVEDLITFMQGGESVIGDIFESMGISAEDGRKMVTDAFNKATKFISGVVETGRKVIGGAIGFVRGVISDFVDAIGSRAGRITTAVGNIAKGLSPIAEGIGDMIGKLAGIGGKIDLGAIIDKLVGAFTGLLEIFGRVGEFLSKHEKTVRALTPVVLSLIAAFVGFRKVSPILKTVSKLVSDFKVDPLIAFMVDFPKAFEAITGITGKVKSFAGIFKAIPAIFKAVSGPVGAVLKLFGGGIGTIGKFIGIAAKLALPFAPYIAIAAAVVAAGVLIYKNWDKIKETAGKLAGAVKEKFGAIKDAVVEKFNAIKDSVKETWDNVKNGIAEKIDAAKDKIADFKDKAGEAFNKVKDSAKDKLTAAKDAIAGFGASVRDKAVGAFDALKGKAGAIGGNILGRVRADPNMGEGMGKAQSALDGVKNGLKSGINAIKSLLSGDFAGAFDNAKMAATSAFGAIKDAASAFVSFLTGGFAVAGGIVQNVGQYFTDMGQNVGGVLGEVLTGIGNFVTNVGNGLSKISTIIPQAFQGAIDFLTGLPAKALQWGSDFIDGLKQGIQQKIEEVVSTVKGLADKIKGFLHFSRPDTGPLRDYEQWMPDMMAGMAEGIERSKNTVLGKARDIATGIKEALGTAGSLPDNVVKMQDYVGKMQNLGSSGRISVPTTRSSTVNNSNRTSMINQTNQFYNQFYGDDRKTQKNIEKSQHKSAISASQQMADAIKYARG